MPDSEPNLPSVQRIVAIAASAGGLEATSALSHCLPTGQNCCYVIAQHMSSSHKSMLVPLLSRETTLEVVELDSQTMPRADVIYIPPPGFDVVYTNGFFELCEPAGHPASPKPSADRLFASLAENIGENAIGIVLSGTGSDGSYGVQSIREQGGITIAQEPESCKFDSMPAAAIRTGCIDLMLTPELIGENITAILRRPQNEDELCDIQKRSTRGSDLFGILYAHTQVNFRQYKENTINRRIRRRMIARGIDSFDSYVDLCRQSVEEVEALYSDLLISVTWFFRDPPQFAELGQILERRVAENPPSGPMRLWVPGCATGEEAFSIAILAAEALGGLENLPADALQVFATDIDERALNIGRKGVYPLAATRDIPDHLLERYFDEQGDEIRVKQKLRNFVMFSRHNVFHDAPFIGLDLVSIRNVLIYFNAKLQERVLTRIIYALKPKALLMLGSSESLGSLDRQFRQIAKDNRLYQMREEKFAHRLSDAAIKGIKHAVPSQGEHLTGMVRSTDEWKNFDRLATAVVENGLLLNRDRTVLRVYGDVAPFSELTSQSFANASVAILKKPLGADGASLALVALKNKEKRSGQWHQLPGMPGQLVRLTAYPMTAAGDLSDDLALLGIEVIAHEEPEPPLGEKTDYVQFLEDEMTRLRDALQVTIDLLQNSNEDLQTVNEELQSSNEELQSTNEELETSNEELQSTNEELITVNEELIVNSTQLERTTAELGGLINNTPTALLMVDQGFVIRHASREAISIFRLNRQGVGLGHLSQMQVPPGFPNLLELCSRCLVSRDPLTRHFWADEMLHILSIAPLAMSEDQQIGLVLHVQALGTDNTRPSVLRQLREFANVETWRVLLPGDASKPALPSDIKFLDGAGGITLDALIETVHPDDRTRVAQELHRAASTLSGFRYTARVRGRTGLPYLAEVSGEAVQNAQTGGVSLLGVSRNVTEIRNQDPIITQLSLTSRRGEGFYSLDLVSDLVYLCPLSRQIFGVDPGDILTKAQWLANFENNGSCVTSCFDRARDTSDDLVFTETVLRCDGSGPKLRGSVYLSRGEDGKITHIYGGLAVLDDDALRPDKKLSVPGLHT